MPPKKGKRKAGVAKASKAATSKTTTSIADVENADDSPSKVIKSSQAPTPEEETGGAKRKGGRGRAKVAEIADEEIATVPSEGKNKNTKKATRKAKKNVVKGEEEGNEESKVETAQKVSPKKRGRPKKDVPIKEDQDDEEKPSPKKRGRAAKVDVAYNLTPDSSGGELSSNKTKKDIPKKKTGRAARKTAPVPSVGADEAKKVRGRAKKDASSASNHATAKVKATRVGSASTPKITKKKAVTKKTTAVTKKTTDSLTATVAAAAAKPVKLKAKAAKTSELEINEMLNDLADRARSSSPISASDFQELNANDLKKALKHNDRTTTGARPHLVEEIIRCMTKGCPPRCPSCGGGRLKYGAYDQAGENEFYYCPGYYDDGEFVQCGHEAHSMDVKTVEWKKL